MPPAARGWSVRAVYEKLLLKNTNYQTTQEVPENEGWGPLAMLLLAINVNRKLRHNPNNPPTIDLHGKSILLKKYDLLYNRNIISLYMRRHIHLHLLASGLDFFKNYFPYNTKFWG